MLGEYTFLTLINALIAGSWFRQLEAKDIWRPRDAAVDLQGLDTLTAEQKEKFTAGFQRRSRSSRLAARELARRLSETLAHKNDAEAAQLRGKLERQEDGAAVQDGTTRGQLQDMQALQNREVWKGHGALGTTYANTSLDVSVGRAVIGCVEKRLFRFVYPQEHCELVVVSLVLLHVPRMTNVAVAVKTDSDAPARCQISHLI